MKEIKFTTSYEQALSFADKNFKTKYEERVGNNPGYIQVVSGWAMRACRRRWTGLPRTWKTCSREDMTDKRENTVCIKVFARKPEGAL